MPLTSAPGLTGIEALGSGIARNIPAYNALGSIWHLLTGTLGTHGPSPSILGRITAAISGNPNNTPPPSAAAPGSPISISSDPYGPPAPPTGNNTDNSNPSDPRAYLDARNRVMAAILNSPNGFNATRAPFGQTWQQVAFPGSAIGPFQGPSVPYGSTDRAQAGLGTPNTVDASLPGWAGALMADIRARNQL